MNGGPLGGVLMIGAAIALVELWRRGYLAGAIAEVTAAAKGAAPFRAFRLPTDATPAGFGSSVLVAQ